MRAAVLHTPGAGLAIERIPRPTPGPGEVLSKVAACGVCHSDLHVLDGKIAFPVPAVLGHEVAGTVAALGADTAESGLAVGDPIAAAFLMPCGTCEACAKGRDDLCEPFFTRNRLAGTLYDGTSRLVTPTGEPIAQYSMGGLAEFAVAPIGAVAPVPAAIDRVDGAILGCAALTAYGAVRRGADLRFGETCAVVAVGGVGANIVQIAAALGARTVIAIDVADDKLTPLLARGATHVVNSATSDPREAVHAITGGRGVDIAFEALGIPPTWSTALSVLADGGRMVPIGLGSGTGSAAVPINQIVRRSQRIIGSYGARTRQDLPAVIDLAARGVISYRDVVQLRLPLERAGEGYDLLRTGGINGRAVVDMSK
jgi:S-(hydroxymethyl)glutathione dehydrogenase/alcohol dehydrogenase